MAKRSSTDYSLVVGIDKPSGMSSHDVVNRVRRIYGERRCGHMGTLDPAATGVLAVCVGPATRLDAFLTSHEKVYEFTIVFGTATDTDDAQGRIVERADVPAEASDADFASRFAAGLEGETLQMPPVYSAIKIGGRKSYEAARSGDAVDLAPRRVRVRECALLAVEGTSTAPVWRLRACVSAGTYIRSIARDTGKRIGTCAHTGELRRVRAGALRADDCVTLEELAARPFAYLADPVALLGLPYLVARGDALRRVEAGAALPAAQAGPLFLPPADPSQAGAAPRVLGAESAGRDGPSLADGRLVSVLTEGGLKAIYEYDEGCGAFKSRCGFAREVVRGTRV